MSVLKAVWLVGVDLVVGDDPKIALAVVAALGLAAALLVVASASAATVTVSGAVLLGAAFGFSLLHDTRSRPRNGSPGDTG